MTNGSDINQRIGSGQCLSPDSPLAGILLISAFVINIFVYMPILLRSRMDSNLGQVNQRIRGRLSRATAAGLISGDLLAPSRLAMDTPSLARDTRVDDAIPPDFSWAIGWLIRMPRSRKDYTHHVRKHASYPVRLIFVLAGTGCVAAGIAGIFIPVLPTTPFLLVAAACYARASNRFYNGLLNNRLFGPAILEWQQHRSIRDRTKWVAIVMMALTLGSSIVFFVDDGPTQILLAALGVLLALHIYHLPSRDR